MLDSLSSPTMNTAHSHHTQKMVSQKKKTKNKKPPGQDASMESPTATSAGAVVIGQGNSTPFKTLTVSPTRTKLTDPNQKVLFLSEQDLIELHLSSHDEVLIFSMEDKGCTDDDDDDDPYTVLSNIYQTQYQQQNACMAVCQVQLLKPVHGGTSSQHRKTLSASSQATLTGPSWFIQTFLKDNNTFHSSPPFEETSVVASTLSTPSYSSNNKNLHSASTPTFSFTHLSSPSTPNKASTPSPKLKNTTPTTIHHVMVIPIPFLQERRHILSSSSSCSSFVSNNNKSIHHFIGKAESITLQPMELSWEIPSTLEPSTLELLLVSYLYKLYVCIQDVVAVSILGQRVLFRITHVQEKQQHDDVWIYQMSFHTRIHVVQVAQKDDVNESSMILSSFSNLSVSPDDWIPPPHTQPTPRKQIIAGLDTILHQMYSYILPSIFSTSSFSRHSPIRPSKGLLLHGPFGVGKTLLAQQIVLDFEFYNSHLHLDTFDPFPSSILQPSSGKQNSLPPLHRKVHVEWVSCAYLQAVSSFVGEGEKILTRIFDQAEYRAQKEEISSLIILDDIHLIGSTRSFQGSASRITSTLLALLDGIGKIMPSEEDDKNKIKGHVYVLAITSKPMELDSALRRAGRMDKELEAPIPDELCRGEIFSFLFQQLQSHGIDMDPCLYSAHEITRISKLAKGFTGADCTLCVKEAVREAILSKPREDSSTNSSSEKTKVTVTLESIQRAIRKTKPSSIKSISVEIPSVPWSSIGGMSQVKQQLREAIEYPLKYGHVFQKMNIPPPKGILLYGPPGCSKTLMARALATEGHMNFLAVKGPELLSKWLGESERALASLFHRARMASPCVIFFDEIDAIGSKRGQSDGSTGGDRLLSQLLTELDGVSTSSGMIATHDDTNKIKEQPRVVVVGATNRPDLLDSALIRPGRIDRMIYVGLPDESSREDIFRIALKNKVCSLDVDPSELAVDALSGGFSGAEIVSICQEAALFALEEDDNLEGSTTGPCICRRHVLRTIQGKMKQITPEMIQFYQSFQKQVVL